MNDHTGEQFGHYRLIRLLDSGGFADVYLGEHMYLKTPCAIKVLQTHLFEDEQQQHFLHEARTIAHLNHPHIIQVLDFGVEDQTPFLVMSYAPHGNLRQRYPVGTRIPTATSIEYIKQIASALQFAHEQRLIHRDIKPENLLLDKNDDLLLSDFGIAIIANSSHSQEIQDIVGTVTYMAPEQIRGFPQPASDQYALAALAYEWLSGKPPFDALSSVEIARMHLQVEPLSLTQTTPDIAPSVAEVISRALAKDYHQRFATIQQFAEALEQAYLTGIIPTKPSTEDEKLNHVPSIRERTHKQRTMRRTTIGILAGMAALAVGGGSWFALTRSQSKALTIIPKATPTPTTSIPSPTPDPAPPSTLGNTVNTYSGHNGAIYALSWSPSGQRIVSAGADQTVQVWDALTSDLVLSRNDYAGYTEGVAWSPNGTSIASDGPDQTVRIWGANNQQQKLSLSGHGAIAWSPDSQYLALADSPQAGYIQVRSTTTGAPIATYYQQPGSVMPSGEQNSIGTIAWSPNGKYIATAGYDGSVQVWSPLRGTKISDYTGHITALGSIAPSSIDGPQDVLEQPHNGMNEHSLLGTLFPASATPYVVFSLAWSPDSTSVASACLDNTVQISDALSGRHILSFTQHTDGVISVAWSPDGKRIVSGDNTGTVYIWDARTGNVIYNYTGHRSAVYCVAWSPNGQLIVSGDQDSEVLIWKAE